MNILILCCLPEEYNNSSMLCVSLLCKGFIEAGHAVAIASPEPDENHRYYNPNYRNEAIQHIRFGHRIQLHKQNPKMEKKESSLKQVVLSVYRKFDIFGRSILNLKYSDDLLSEIKKSGFNPNLILSTSDPKSSHLISNKLKKSGQFNVPFVQYWGDPLAKDIASQSILPFWVKKIIEKSIIKKAEVIAYVSPITALEQKKLFKKYANKIIFSPTPCELQEFGNVGDSYTIGYFGSYNSSVRNIIPLYEAVKRNPKFHLYLVGDSDIELQQVENIEVIDRIPAEDLEMYYKKCGIIIDLMNTRGGQIPAKLFRDAGTNKEILLISDSDKSEEIISFFEKYNRYTICSNTVDDISSALKQYEQSGIPNRNATSEFEYHYVSSKLLEDIKHCIERK